MPPPRMRRRRRRRRHHWQHRPQRWSNSPQRRPTTASTCLAPSRLLQFAAPSAKVVVAARVTRRCFELDADGEPLPCEEDVEENAVSEARPPDGSPSEGRRRFGGRRASPLPCGLEGAIRTGGCTVAALHEATTRPHPGRFLPHRHGASFSFLVMVAFPNWNWNWLRVERCLQMESKE